MAVGRLRRLAAGLGVAALSLAACGTGGDTIAVEVFPARLDERPDQTPPEGWRRVEFGGSQRSRAGVYLVAAEPLITGWNIVAFRAAEEPDGSRAISFRLNAAGRQKMAQFAARQENLKAPLAVRVDGRWADFSPLLDRPRDRMALYGFTAAEAERLQRWLASR